MLAFVQDLCRGCHPGTYMLPLHVVWASSQHGSCSKNESSQRARWKQKYYCCYSHKSAQFQVEEIQTVSLNGKITRVTFRTRGMRDLVAATLENTIFHTAQLGIASRRTACGLTPRAEMANARRRRGSLIKGFGCEVGGRGRIQTLLRQFLKLWDSRIGSDYPRRQQGRNMENGKNNIAWCCGNLLGLGKSNQSFSGLHFLQETYLRSLRRILGTQRMGSYTGVRGWWH